jgi:cytochrome c-type biogenesis protein CcmE
MDQPTASPSSRRRAKFAIGAGTIVFALVGLIGWAMARPGSTAYYLTPSELQAKGPSATKVYRVSGDVLAGSIRHNGLRTTFSITDARNRVTVTTDQPLPSAFKPGAQVVADGTYDGTAFSATQVLAKCPSKFKPKS